MKESVGEQKIRIVQLNNKSESVPAHLAKCFVLSTLIEAMLEN